MIPLTSYTKASIKSTQFHESYRKVFGVKLRNYFGKIYPHINICAVLQEEYSKQCQMVKNDRSSAGKPSFQHLKTLPKINSPTVKKPAFTPVSALKKTNHIPKSHAYIAPRLHAVL